METENNINDMQAHNADNAGASETAQNPADGREESMRLTRKFMQVGWLVNRFLQQKRSEMGPMGDPHRGQGRILALLKLQPGISQSELAYLLGMRPQSAGELLAKLERAGLIERTQSESDKRVLHVKLTLEGEKAAEQRVKGKGPFSVLDADEKETLGALLQKVADGLAAQLGETGDAPFPGDWKRGGWKRGWRGDGSGDQPGAERGRGRGRGPRGPEGRGGPRHAPESAPSVEMYFDMRGRKGFGPRRGQRGPWGKQQTNGTQV
jgi:DNA-binding MarR family transcriptional regulator